MSLKGRRPDNARPAKPIFDMASIGFQLENLGANMPIVALLRQVAAPGASNARASCISIPTGLEVIYCSNSRCTQPG